jgi:two-component system NtrC family sensor kinase
MALVASIIEGEADLEQLSPSRSEAVLDRLARPRLVCADDSPTLLIFLKTLLDPFYDVELVDDGQEAFEAIRTHPPDTILSDVAMPRMTGLDLLVQLKQDPRLCHIPFIVMTANHEQQSAAEILDAGAHDFLEKPFGPEELRARVGAAVRSHLMYKELEGKHLELSRMHSLLTMSEARTRAIIGSAYDGIVTMATDGTVEALNPSAERIFGLENSQACGHSFIEEFVAPECQSRVAAEMTRIVAATAIMPPAPRRQIAGRRGNGQEFPMECLFTRVENPAGTLLCAFVRDLTESKRLEIELQQAQKLEAVGRLAAGIAHEINTPIQYIGDNTRFLGEALNQLTQFSQKQREVLESVGLSPEARQELDKAAVEAELDYLLSEVPDTLGGTLQGLQRVATIVRAMMEFAHPDRQEMVSTDLNRVLQATIEVSRNEYKYVAEMETDFGQIPPVICHAGDMSQAFLNIIVNAAHAITDVSKQRAKMGKVRVSTVQEGNDVLVTIQDDGGGIPESIRGKIFDPFFTTKEVGRGTGQGLAIAHALIEKHRGTLTFESEIGVGTSFHVRVPIDGAIRERETKSQ